MITYMCELLSDYTDIPSEAFNGDNSTWTQYLPVEERIACMADPTTLPGELEIIAAGKLLQRPAKTNNSDLR